MGGGTITAALEPKHPHETCRRKHPAIPEMKQEKTESCQHFVDRLHEAITSQAGLENHEKKFMFHLFALENASQRTILEMFEVAGRVN
ncbi:hypothetical protein WISP_63615 [Willisornis vidua]|uniref:Retroviral nucleocapsid Gag protein p24 C-terminal domain-containing protein n=1 Tax=Willisornis vidua TaxID=1566151 RepID=A0ABQ9D9Q9_9PASS|nr:hypothetical protein WISP_63615 [Willisornis vidua]